MKSILVPSNFIHKQGSKIIYGSDLIDKYKCTDVHKRNMADVILYDNVKNNITVFSTQKDLVYYEKKNIASLKKELKGIVKEKTPKSAQDADTYTMLSVGNMGMVELIDIEDPSAFINKSICIYGGSGTGKTTLLKTLLESFRPHVGDVWFMSGSEPSNHAYGGISKDPKKYVSSTLDYDLINNIIKGQQMKISTTSDVNITWCIANVYGVFDNSNDPLLLKIKKAVNSFVTLCVMLKAVTVKSTTTPTVEDAKSAYKLYTKYATSKINPEAVYPTLDVQPRYIKHKSNTELLEHINKIILREIVKSSAAKALLPSDVFRLISNYVNLECVIVIDDLTSDISTALKGSATVVLEDGSKIKSSGLIKELFFKGRHNHITVIILLQSALALEPTVRSNVMVNIFTDFASFSTFVKRSVQDRRDVLNTIEEYNKHTNVVTNQRLLTNRPKSGYPRRAIVYTKDSPTKNNFFMYRSNIIDNFKI